MESFPPNPIAARDSRLSLVYSEAIWSEALPDPYDKLVMLALATRSNEMGQCWTSLSHLQRITGMSHTAICRKLSGLEAAGKIRRDKGKGVRGGPSSTRYTLWPSAAKPEVAAIA